MINLSWNKIIHFIKKLFQIKKEFENALKNIHCNIYNSNKIKQK